MDSNIEPIIEANIEPNTESNIEPIIEPNIEPNIELIIEPNIEGDPMHISLCTLHYAVPGGRIVFFSSPGGEEDVQTSRAS